VLHRPLARLCTIATGCLTVIALSASGAHADPGPAPDSMASMGDSITRGFNACGFYVECTSRSWSTGSSTSVNSHYVRIRAVNPAISGNNFNDARSGAQADDMVRQAGLAVGQDVDYVTMLIGANDACTSTEGSMTPVDTFGNEIRAALDVLHDGLPDARVFIASIPDVYHLWEIGRGSAWIRFVWSTFGICQSLLANAGSSSPANEARRQRVQDRVIAYNAELDAACDDYEGTCEYDGETVFEFDFTLDHVSSWDYFHPNTNGQRALAAATYAVGFGW
jgi:lysophospholipase L1-like esterase